MLMVGNLLSAAVLARKRSPHVGMILGEERGIADTPALGCYEHAAAVLSLEGKGRPGVVDKAADLLLEV